MHDRLILGMSFTAEITHVAHCPCLYLSVENVYPAFHFIYVLVNRQWLFVLVEYVSVICIHPELSLDVN